MEPPLPGAARPSPPRHPSASCQKGARRMLAADTGTRIRLIFTFYRHMDAQSATGGYALDGAREGEGRTKQARRRLTRKLQVGSWCHKDLMSARVDTPPVSVLAVDDVENITFREGGLFRRGSRVVVQGLGLDSCGTCEMRKAGKGQLISLTLALVCESYLRLSISSTYERGKKPFLDPPATEPYHQSLLASLAGCADTISFSSKVRSSSR